MADEIIAKYKADLKDYNSEIKKGTGQAEKDFGKVDESASGLSKTMGKLGGAIAAAFAVDRIASFTAEASKLAAQGEGVRKAFERIGDPQLLQGLRDATRGTVSDLELMKNAVKASNFKIPLQELAKLFEFARRRAKETGESVQFLVESITTGIGRKSPLILDNLGISAVELKKRLNGVSLEASSIGDVAQVVGEIATDAMRSMGEEVESTKDKMDKLTASTDNLKEALGTIANEVVGPLASGLSVVAQSISDELTEMDRLRSELVDMGAPELDRRLKDEQAILDKLEEDLTARIGRISDAQASIAQGEIDDYQERVRIIEEYITARQDGLDIEDFTIDQIAKKVAALKDLTEVEMEQIKNVAYWRAEIKRLQEELNNGNMTIDQNIATVNALTHATKELNKILKPTVDEFERLRSAQGALIPIEAKDIQNVQSLEDSIDGINQLLKEQNAIRSAAPFMSEEFAEATAEIDRLEERLIAMQNRLKQANVEIVEDDTKATMAKMDNLDTYMNAATSSFGTITQIAMQQANERYDFEQNLLNQQFQQGLITEEEFTQKSGELKRKQAQQAKDLRLYETILNTAAGIVSALAQTPPNVAQSIATGVTGALQAALIGSQPIPQFAKGTKEAPSGFKWVGEEGPELIYDQGGYPIITHRESMKIMEKYNIPSINYEAVEQGGFENMAQSAALNGFNDSNLLVGLDRSRTATVRELRLLRSDIKSLSGINSRNVW